MNWGRWARSSGSRRGRCGSAEGLYAPRRIDVDETARDPRPPDADVHDALVVARALSTANGFPARLAFVLTGEFVHRLPPGPFCGYLARHGFRVRARQLAALVDEAIEATERALR